MIGLAMIPPVWRHVMHGRLPVVSPVQEPPTFREA